MTIEPGAGMSPPVLQPPIGHFALVRILARGWWLILLRGVAALVFGLVALFFPIAGIAVLLAMLAAWAAVDGALTLWQAIAGGGVKHRLWLVIEGAVSLLAAVVLIVNPALSAVALVVFCGVWIAAAGVFRLIQAFQTRGVLLGLYGAVTVLLGAWLIAAPGPGLLALAWLIGFQALLVGGLLLALGWRLRRIAHDPHA